MQYSAKYIVTFAALVCLVCGIFVSSLAVALKETQENNKVLDRQIKVLTVAGLMEEGASKTPDEVQALFDEYIGTVFVDLASGKELTAEELEAKGIDPARFDDKKYTKEKGKAAPANPAGVPRVPDVARVFQLKRGDKVAALILPVHGKGLWSTMYGYVAVAEDGNTIKGLTFYEHGETPGLGGEVDNPAWKGLWPGRKIYEGGVAKINVIKGPAGPAATDPYNVDGLSGATITGRGVGFLLQFWLGDVGFKSYIAAFAKKGGAS